MPVTRAAALKALETLRKSSSVSFAACQGNAHLFEAHASKGAALVAVEKGAAKKGYFKQTLQKDIIEEYEKKRKGKTRTLTRKVGEKTGTTPLEGGADTLWQLVNAAFRGTDFEVYESEKADRFVYVGAMPEGFAGRSMVRSAPEPVKVRDGLSHVAIVIGGCNGGNLNVITAFPVAGSYVHGLKKLA